MDQVTSTHDLIERIQGGDEIAFTNLFDKYQKRLAVLIHYKLSPELRRFAEVEDVLQDTLLEAFRDINRFRYEKPGSFLAWLGQVENLTYLAARDGSLNQLPIGTPLIADSKLNAYEIFAADTWRITPSLTFSYGLMYTWQVPPVEARGQQTIVLDNDTGDLINPKQYLRQKFEAAAEGRIFNPTLAYLPINESGRKYAFNIDRKNFSPRVAAAWTPTFSGGVMGRLFGDRKTVLRGGYSLLYDRINTVQTVIIPTLGVGFAQTLESGTVRNSSGQPFRVGADGPLAIPTLPPTTSPIVPLQNTPAEVLSFVVDPFITVPRNHTLDFTLQRELPNGLIMEVGYIGRFGRNLYQSINLNQVPFNFKDPRSGQTFAQAFDLLADQLRAGVPAAQVTSQPWFENLLVNLPPPVGGSRTTALAARQSANLINGNMSNLFIALNSFAGLSFINPQARELFFRTSGGSSNYHGVFFTVRKRFAGGLAFDANYTFSRSLDQVGLVQNAAGLVPNSFNLNAEYAPSNFDITHIFNSNFVYELPFGKGRRFGDTSNSILSRLVSGWTTSGILRAASGFPLTIVQGTQVWGGSQLLGTNSGAIGLSNADFTTGIFDGVKGSGNTGTSGNPATRGSGLNIFSNPEAVFKSVRRVHLSEDGRSGRNSLKGLGTWQFDFALSKETRITEQVRFSLSVEFINFFNHVNFADPTVSLQAQATFGVISAQRIDNTATASQGGFTPRRIQIGARIDF